MSRPLRIEVGNPRTQEPIPFPPPGHDFGPRRIATAASYVLTDDYWNNVSQVYRLIGYDAGTLAKHLRFTKKEQALIETGQVPSLSKIQKDLRPVVRALGLELVTGLFLDCLDSPAKTICPCELYTGGDRPFPSAPAGSGFADARADYEGFTIVAEATIAIGIGPLSLQAQYNSAVSHIATVLAERNLERGYCLMVSRAKLRDEHVPALIVEKQEKLRKDHGLDNVRILAFGIDEMAHIAKQLDRLYPDGKDVKPLTAEVLADILDVLHGEMMERISSDEAFPDQWAARQFEELLKTHASGMPLKTLDLPAKQAGEAARPDL